ncbi:MAG: HEAT repeat domain-containing protein [Planctomycetota bacterium]
MRYSPLLLLLAGLAVSLSGCGLFGGLQEPTSTDAWIEELLAAEDARDGECPLFRQALEQPDRLVRRTAYRALGRTGGESAIPLLVASAREELDPGLRAEALYAVGLTGLPGIVEAVETFLLDSDVGTRAAVIRALGLSGDTQALVTLLSALDDPAVEVRAEAALALARLFSIREDPVAGRSVGAFLALGVRMVRDVSPEVRWRSAYACSKLKLEEMRERFHEALGDESDFVRLFACEGLGELDPDPASRGLLIEALVDDSWTVVVEAAKALGKDPAPETLLALSRALGHGQRSGHASHHVRAAVARTLRQFSGVEGCVGVLKGALLDGAESVRDEALESLAQVADPGETLALLTEMLGEGAVPSPSVYLRSRAAGAAAALPDARGLPIVMELARDPAPAVRSAAVASLASFEGHAAEAEPILRSALAERDVALRDAAATSALALGLDSLRPDLERALKDSAGADFIEPRVSLLKALAGLGGQAMAPLLRDFLQDDERAVRTAARDELARLGGAIPNLPRPSRPERLITPRAGRDLLTGKNRPRVRLITSRGPFVLELLVDEAPHHALAFLERCRSGFYDGLTFHRMVPGFVVQGLDPRGDGYGTGRLSLRSEVNQERYGRGSVGMPDAGPDTGGCQIFVTFRPQPRLDDRYTIFAHVVEGMEVVEQLDLGDRVDYVVAPPAPE